MLIRMFLCTGLVTLLLAAFRVSWKSTARYGTAQDRVVASRMVTDTDALFVILICLCAAFAVAVGVS